MSKDPTLTMSSVLNETEQLVSLMKKVEGKRKMLEEARIIYNQLCAKVENDKYNLTEIKMERFKMEGLLQELEIRMKLYEQREKELRDDGERARTSIKQAEEHQKHEYGVQDAQIHYFRKKVVELTDGYRNYKRFCDQATVAASLQDLRASEASIAKEIQQLLNTNDYDAVDKITSNFLISQPIPVVVPDLSNEETISNIRQVRSHLKKHVESILASDTELQIELDQLEIRKTLLHQEINALREKLEK